MALTITLSDGTTTATVSASPYGIRYGGLRLGNAERNRVFSQPWGRGFSPLAGVTEYNRQCEIDIWIRGTSLDDWGTNYRALAALLKRTQDYWKTSGERGAACLLSVQLDGQTNATTYDVLAGEFDAANVAQPSMQNTAAPYLSNAQLRLTLKPWGRPAAELTTTSATLTNGGGTSGGGTTAMSHIITSPAGTQDAPMRVTWQGGNAGLGYGRVIMGRKTRGTVANFIADFRAETTVSTTGQSTYPGYTVGLIGAAGYGRTRVVDAAAGNGVFMRYTKLGAAAVPTAQPLMNWGIDSASDFHGSYRVFLKFSTAVNASQITLSLGYGGDSATWLASTPPITGVIVNPETLLDMGTITIPVQGIGATVGQAPFWITLLASSTSAVSGQISGIDELYLIPSDEEYLDVRVSATGGDKIVMDDLSPRPSAYVADSASLAKRTVDIVQRTPLRAVPGEDNLWVALVLSTTGTTAFRLTDNYTLKFDYLPLYDQFAT